MAIDRITFRGARPLRKDDREHLVGRKRDLNELCNRCESYDIVQITAPSGVGKTSFVVAGGIQEVEARDFYVPPIRQWSDWLAHPGLRERGGDASEYAEVLYRLMIGVEDENLDPRDGRHIADVVEAVAGDRRMVVVIDQMEELLRFQESVGNALLRLAGQAARDANVPHVVIARSEYRERLEPVEVRGATVWNLRLREITSPKAIEQIIRGPVDTAKVEIADEAVRKFRSWWEAARDAPVRNPGLGADPLGTVGLLHLQSLLWSFEQWAVEDPEHTAITVPALDAFAADRAEAGRFDASDERAGAALIEDAISSYVEDCIAKATERAVVRDDDESERELTWRNGPRVMLARVAPALSSGGYKVPQALSSLIPLALGDELTQPVAQDLADAVRARRDIAEYAQTTDVRGAGIGAGWPKERLLPELVDSLKSILQALSSEDANILRQFNVTDEPVYELVHDGVGRALTRWSREFLARPISSVGVIAARPGGAFNHSLSPATFLNDDGEVEPHWGAVEVVEVDGSRMAVLKDVRWDANAVIALRDGVLAMRDVHFKRCDCTGAAFVGCEFENVTFEQCVFKGAVMIACKFNSVSFMPASDAGDDLNLLTIKNPVGHASVLFDGLAGTRGLFLEGLSGGTWTIRNSKLSHLVASGRDDMVETMLRLEGTLAEHVTIEGGVRIDDDQTT